MSDYTKELHKLVKCLQGMSGDNYILDYYAGGVKLLRCYPDGMKIDVFSLGHVKLPLLTDCLRVYILGYGDGLDKLKEEGWCAKCFLNDSE